MPFANLTSTELYYESNNANDSNQSIIFIHGLGSSTRDWHNQVDYFEHNFNVITVDLHGFGKSDRSHRKLSIHDYAQDIIELTEYLQLAQPHIVGLSLGAMICYEIVTSQPRLIKSVAVINALPEFVARTYKEKFSVFMRFAIVRLLGMQVLGKILSKKLFKHPEQQQWRDEFLQNWQQNKRHNYLSAMKAILNWSVVEKLNDIKTPILVVAAEHDYTPVHSKQPFVTKYSNITLQVIANSWHATPIDQAAALNEMLAVFYKIKD